MGKKVLIFTTLAMNQTLFFKKIGDELKAHDLHPAYLPFHERSHDLFIKSGDESFNVFDHARKHPVSREETEGQFYDLRKRFQLPDSHVLLSHEKTSFEIADDLEVQEKFVHYIRGISKFIEDIRARGDQIIGIVQELGGFSSLLSSYFVARSMGIDNYFLEPAFFRGRFFLIKNSLESLNVNTVSNQLSQPVESYLNDTLQQGRIVIPEKDKKHYWSLRKKIINLYNFRRFYQKLADKYIFGKREEFSYIGRFTRRHLMMFFNKFYFSRFYKREIPAEKFVYYPLHVPMDVALTLRSPQYLDQYALIDYISRSLPFGYRLAVKEHPAMVGVMNRARMKDLLSRNPNIDFLHPSINNFEILRRSDAVVTVNSKSGAEALLCGGRVLVLGDAFYRNCPLVTLLLEPKKLGSVLQEILNQPLPDKKMVFHYFEQVWRQSHPGEIYSLNSEHVQSFSRAILQALAAI